MSPASATKAAPSAITNRSEIAQVIAVEGDVLPTQRRNVRKKLVGNDFAARAQLVDGAAEIGGVPQDDGGDGEIEAGGAVALVLEGPIADFARRWKNAARARALRASPLLRPALVLRRKAGSLIQSSVNNVRSKRPISLSALASAFCRG